MDQNKLAQTDAKTLAGLIDLEPSGKTLWQAEEPGAILRHQLSVPLRVDLAGRDDPTAARLSDLSKSRQFLSSTFSDLMHSRNPPVDVLVLLKDFAKVQATHRDSPLPPDVAKVLYYLAISPALIRCQKRITRIDNEALGSSLRWAIALPWMVPEVRDILNQALT